MNLFAKNDLTILLLFLMLFSTSCQDWYESSIKNNSLYLRILPSPDSRSGNALEENAIGSIQCILYDTNGEVEAMRSYDTYQNDDLTFNNLSEGQKTLVVIANTENALSLEPLEIVPGLKKELDSLLVRLKSPYVFTKPGTIPMIHESQLSVPAEKPEVEVSLSRLFSRVMLVNDIDNFSIDSLIFQNLTVASDIKGRKKVVVKETASSLEFQSDNNKMPVYILPCAANQIKYSVVGKTSLGVTQVIEGMVKPELNSNNSYTMSLSTGMVTVDGTPQNIQISINDSVGTYSPEGNSITIHPGGGTFSIIAESIDSLEVSFDPNEWLDLSDVTTKANFTPSAFLLRSAEYITEDQVRETKLHIRNKHDSTKNTSITVKQVGENRGPKYYVVVVAGQSNASGRDRTAYDAKYDTPSPRIFELGMANITPPYVGKFDGSSTLSIVPLHYIGQSLDSYRMGAKSLHLYLGKEVLKHIPEDYNVLVVSVAYSGTGFTNPGSPIGVYDPVNMRAVAFPRSMPNAYRFKAREGVLYNMLVDRVKYALNTNKRNKLIGVVWLQGESDTSAGESDPYVGFTMFEDFAQSFTDDINNSVSPEQLALGQFNRNMWFNVEHTPGRRYWHDTTGNPLQFSRSHYYGGYKIWNFSSFIKLPEDVGMNPGDEVHFGQNAFRLTIAPLTVQCMTENQLFGSAPAPDDKFVRKISAAEIKKQMGSIDDKDIQDGLIAYLPFTDAAHVEKNLSKNKDQVNIVNHGLQTVNAEGLIDAQKAPRKAKVLALTPSSGKYMEINNSLPGNPTGWSVSFMMRRYKAQDNLDDQHLLLISNTKSGIFCHRFQKEAEGRYLTVSFQPSATSYDRLKSVTSRIIDANYVRSNEEWIHYTYTYDNATCVCSVYMNGELTMSYTLANEIKVSDLSQFILNDPLKGINAHINSLCIWNRAITAQTAFKIYLMGYYGQEAKIEIDTEIGDYEDEEISQ